MCATARFTLHGHLAAVLCHDAVHDVEAKSGATTGGLGRKERIENRVNAVCRNPDPVVRNGGPNDVVGSPKCDVYGTALTEMLLRDSFHSVLNEVHEDLSDFGGSSVQIQICRATNLHPCRIKSNRANYEADGVLHHAQQVHGGMSFPFRAAAVAGQLGDDFPDRLRVVYDFARIPPDEFRIVLQKNRFGEPEHAEQRTRHFMCDSSGQRADPSEFLALDQLVLRIAQLVERGLELLVLYFETPKQPLILATHANAVKGLTHLAADLKDILRRFDDVVKGVKLHRCQRRVQGGVARDDDPLAIRVAFARPLQQVQTVHVRQILVGEEDVASLIDLEQRGAPVSARHHVVVLAIQDGCQEVEDYRLVVHEHEPFPLTHVPSPAAAVLQDATEGLESMEIGGNMHPWAAMALLLVSGTALAKKAKQVSDEPVAKQVIAFTTSAEGLITQTIDFDGDGKPEVFNYLRQRAEAEPLLVRKELDLDRDTRVDVISYYDEAGVLEREELDSDFDGRIDAADHYEGGVRVLSEYDTDFDGRANVYKYYNTDGVGAVFLDRKERDTDGDGRIDVWERFNKDGTVIRTAMDTDGDGKMDVREE